MKHSLKISFMAFVAMFAFSTVADAQLGGLLKKAKQAVGVKSKEEKQMEAMVEMQKKDQAQYKAARDQEAANFEAEKKKTFEVMNYATGKMMTMTNLFPPNEPVTAEWLTTTGFMKAQSFSDVESKKNVIEHVIDFMKVQSATDGAMKTRKVVDVLFTRSDWNVMRNGLGVPTHRNLGVWVISELPLGITIAELVTLTSEYQGGGTFAKACKCEMNLDPLQTQKWNVKTRFQYMIKDWKHDPNADPMAQFK